MKFQWFKFNIYAFLLSAISVLSGYIAYLCYGIWWIFVPLMILTSAIFIFSISIYTQYHWKAKIAQRLITKGKKNFDHRLFYPFFDSPCMRSVVYFSLKELNCEDKYWDIKAEVTLQQTSGKLSYTVFLKNDNGITKFYRKDLHTGIVSEIERI